MKHLLGRSVLLLALLLAACGEPAEALPEPQVDVTHATATAAASATPVDTTIDLVDGLGRQVVLPAPAERVVSLAPSNTELLFAVNASAQMVGRDPYSDYPAEAAAIADIGDTYAELNTELITSLEPDLVLAAEITPPEQVAQLEQLGIAVYWLPNPTDLEGLYANLHTVGKLTGHEADASVAADALRARAEAVLVALEDVTERPTVFYEVDGLTDPNAPYTAGAGTFIDLIITLAGGTNAAAALSGYAQVSIEELLVQNPDWILLGDAMYGATPEAVAARAGWGGLAAVQNGQIVPFDDNLMSRPGPRLIDGLEQLARLLHPDQFN
jgi:iron complex transport system substrate-binding protein